MRQASPVPYLSTEQIERRMEDELYRSGMMPTADALVLDIEAFVDSYLLAKVDQYAELPPDVLGSLYFDHGRPHIEINRDLSGSALDDENGPTWLKGRWRATLAHEAAHVILHRALIDPGTGQQKLFEEESPSGVQRCLKRDVGFGPLPKLRRPDNREVQANKGMAALLMPRSLFLQVTRPLLPAAGSDGAASSLDAFWLELASDLAGRFQVSRQAARIRLDTLGLTSLPEQNTLAF